MSAEHKRIARSLVVALAAGDAAAIEQLLDPEYVHHGPLPPITGRALPAQELRRYFVAMHGAFRDLEIVPEDVLAEGDRVAVRWAARGTHQGEFLGVPPTGEALTWTGVAIFRIVAGRVVEGWWTVDALDARIALGLLAPPPRPGGGAAPSPAGDRRSRTRANKR